MSIVKVVKKTFVKKNKLQQDSHRKTSHHHHKLIKLKKFLLNLYLNQMIFSHTHTHTHTHTRTTKKNLQSEKLKTCTLMMNANTKL